MSRQWWGLPIRAASRSTEPRPSRGCRRRMSPRGGSWVGPPSMIGTTSVDVGGTCGPPGTRGASGSRRFLTIAQDRKRRRTTSSPFARAPSAPRWRSRWRWPPPSSSTAPEGARPQPKGARCRPRVVRGYGKTGAPERWQDVADTDAVPVPTDALRAAVCRPPRPLGSAGECRSPHSLPLRGGPVETDLRAGR